MRRLALWVSLAFGCTGGPRYERPDIAVPKAFSEGAGRPTSFERWWCRWPKLDPRQGWPELGAVSD